MKSLKLALVAFFAAPSAFTFAESDLPVLKASSKIIHIRDGLHFKKAHWYMTPSDNPDYYYVEIPQKPHRVTFISDIDSISFDVSYGGEYDFVILVDSTERFQRRISATYKGLVSHVGSHPSGTPDTIPFTVGDNSKIYFKGRLNDSEPLNIQFDLGAGGTVMKKASVKKVVMNFDDSVTLHNSDGTNQVPASSTNVLEVADLRWDSVHIAVADNMTHREDLIVGNSLFKSKVLEINYDQGIIVIHDSLSPLGPEYSRHDIVLDGGTVPFIPASLTFKSNTKSGWFMFDTGAYTSILNSADIPVTNKVLSEAKLMVGWPDPKSSPSLAIGSYRFSDFNYTTQMLNTDNIIGILGNDLLKRFNIILDNKSGYIYLTPNFLQDEPYVNPEYNAVRVIAAFILPIVLPLPMCIFAYMISWL